MMFQGREKTVVDTGRGPVDLDREDARAMGRALVTFLRESAPDIRDELLPWVEKLPGWIGAGGVVRVGRWALRSEGDHLALVLFPERSLGEPPIAWTARIERGQESWEVTRLDRAHLLGWR